MLCAKCNPAHEVRKLKVYKVSKVSKVDAGAFLENKDCPWEFKKDSPCFLELFPRHQTCQFLKSCR